MRKMEGMLQAAEARHAELLRQQQARQVAALIDALCSQQAVKAQGPASFQEQLQLPSFVPDGIHTEATQACVHKHKENSARTAATSLQLTGIGSVLHREPSDIAAKQGAGRQVQSRNQQAPLQHQTLSEPLHEEDIPAERLLQHARPSSIQQQQAIRSSAGDQGAKGAVAAPDISSPEAKRPENDRQCPGPALLAVGDKPGMHQSTSVIDPCIAKQYLMHMIPWTDQGYGCRYYHTYQYLYMWQMVEI